MENKTHPYVSICCITYNHEEFISETVESFLTQQTNFPFEIVISEDCSTDRTREILLYYAQKRQELFRLLFREQNLGAVPNFIETIKACRGKYIALCEGDDYWTDPQKLQKQVDFLESHPECTSCFHNVRYQYDDGEIKPSPYKHKEIKDIYTIEDLLVKNVWTKTCSCMFKNGLINDELNNLSNLKIGDWPSFVLLADKGNIGYIHDEMAVYRVHGNSLFSTIGLDEQYLAIIDSRMTINDYFESKYSSLLKPEIYKYTYLLANHYRSIGENSKACMCYLKCIKNIRYHNNYSRFELFKHLLTSLISYKT